MSEPIERLRTRNAVMGDAADALESLYREVKELRAWKADYAPSRAVAERQVLDAVRGRKDAEAKYNALLARIESATSAMAKTDPCGVAVMYGAPELIGKRVRLVAEDE